MNDAERDWFAAQAGIAAEIEHHAYDEEIAVYESATRAVFSAAPVDPSRARSCRG
jgi:hypothetical protein